MTGKHAYEDEETLRCVDGDGEDPEFDPNCIEHEKCDEGNTLCNPECPLGSLECSGTRKILGLGARPWWGGV